jgi:SET domain-containing protein
MATLTTVKSTAKTKTKAKATISKNADQPALDPRFCNFKLRLGKSKIHRWGVFAAEFIPARRKIMEYTGEKISRRETKRRAEGPLNYLFTLNSYWCIDGNVGGSGAQYVNHCCEPNVYARIVNEHILYVSARDIQRGEELTIDYHFDKDVERVPCACGAAKCRGTINLLE